MSKNKTIQRDKKFSVILFLLFIILIIVFIIMPNERNVTKKVTEDEYKNIIYNEVHNEIYPKENENVENQDVETEEHDHEIITDPEEIEMRDKLREKFGADEENELYEDIDQTLKMNTDV